MSRGPKYTRNLQKESFEYCVTMVSKNIDSKVVFFQLKREHLNEKSEGFTYQRSNV